MAHRRNQTSIRNARKSFPMTVGLMASVASSLMLAACSSIPGVSHLVGTTPVAPLTGNIGTVVADEPQAALVGHEVLARNGNAVDAAVATAVALGVTLPSRASLGGGGACLVSLPGKPAQSFSFLPRPGSSAGGDRPASSPAVLRGLYLIHHTYGSVDFNDLLSPAITLARNGITVSRALASDLTVVHSALLADEQARSTFGRGETGTVVAGDTLLQPRLSAFLSRISVAGTGDLYTGALADVYATAAQKAGGGLNVEDLRQTLPSRSAALTTQANGLTASFLAPPADGGLGAAIRYTTDTSAQGAIAAWRASGATTLEAAQNAVEGNRTSQSVLPPLPASTSFVTVDKSGMAVACALSENNLFGTGRMAGNTGIVLGASPKSSPSPLLSAAILQNGQTLRAVIAGSGQNDAADSVGEAARSIAQGGEASSSGAGRVNAITCTNDHACHGNADPHGSGLSAGNTN